SFSQTINSPLRNLFVSLRSSWVTLSWVLPARPSFQPDIFCDKSGLTRIQLKPESTPANAKRRLHVA
ncbi:hypothetical protein, partial [Alcanivorax sp. HI0083]|uniref:hypothetical protein n=1 Tax=Alcanivorax sp. HI0083 TaxID=1822258 RepID=UPI001E2DCA99